MKTCRSAQGISWVNEGGHLLVVDENRSAAHSLSGPEAALWRWLHQGLAWPEVRDLFCALGNSPFEAGEEQMKAIVGRWVEAGLLEVTNG